MTPAHQSSFDPDFATAAQWAVMYRERGVQIIPCYYPHESTNWKRPFLARWTELQETIVPEAAFQRWYGQGGQYAARDNMGLITGRASGNIFVVDLDTHKHPEAALWWSSLLSLHNYGDEPETWRQTTGGGGRQILFRARSDWHAPTNKTSIGVDIRGQGGFAVLPSSKHDSGRRYSWDEGCEPWLIDIEEAPEWLLEAVEVLVDAHGGDEGKGPRLATERRAYTGPTLDAFGNMIDGREEYMAKVVWAAVLDLYREAPIKPSTTEIEEACATAYSTYERAVKSRLGGATTSDTLDREGRGPQEFGRKWRAAMRQWDGKVAREAEKLPPESSYSDGPNRLGSSNTPPNDNTQSAPSSGATLKLVKAFPIVPSEIEPRDWIVPGLLLRKHLSVLVAPPGSGKSLLTLQIALMCATGDAWGGWKVRTPVKALVINAEDDSKEMSRRLAASLYSMRIDQTTITDQVLLAEDPETIVIAKSDSKTKTVVRTPLQDELVSAIKVNGVDLVIVDPFAETFEGDENSNSEVKWAGIIWREVARRTNTSVLLVHHTKKYASGMAGDADASRGGGSLIGTARIMSTLFAMTEEEASVMSIRAEDRTRYVRFDDAKANMSLVTGIARWFVKDSIQLPNGRLSIPGDEVGVLVPWVPPDFLDGISMAQIHTVIDAIDRGILDEDGRPAGFYTASNAGAKNARWAGKVIANMLGCEEEKAKLILAKWLKNEVFEVFEYDDGKQARKGLRAKPENRPGRVET